MLEPFMPSTSKKIYKFLNLTNPSFNQVGDFALEKEYTIGEYENLFQRLDSKAVLEEIYKEQEARQKEAKKANALSDALSQNLTKEEIGIEDFEKIDLCVGKILEARKHPKADKLLVFKVDLGNEVRQIVSGIAKFYNPDDLVGKKVVVVKNLKAIKLRGEESHGMLLCASDAADTTLELLNVDKLNPGDNIR